MMRCQAIRNDAGELIDLEVLRAEGGAIRILGSGAARRELAVLDSLHAALAQGKAVLPVLLGSGMGHAVAKLAEYSKAFPAIAVVDKELDLIPYGCTDLRMTAMPLISKK